MSNDNDTRTDAERIAECARNNPRLQPGTFDLLDRANVYGRGMKASAAVVGQIVGEIAYLTVLCDALAAANAALTRERDGLRERIKERTSYHFCREVEAAAIGEPSTNTAAEFHRKVAEEIDKLLLAQPPAQPDAAPPAPAAGEGLDLVRSCRAYWTELRRESPVPQVIEGFIRDLDRIAARLADARTCKQSLHVDDERIAAAVDEIAEELHVDWLSPRSPQKADMRRILKRVLSAPPAPAPSAPGDGGGE
jgi:hypothetical protein